MALLTAMIDGDLMDLAYKLQSTLYLLEMDTDDLILLEAILAEMESRGYEISDMYQGTFIFEKKEKQEGKGLTREVDYGIL
jgi:hypothetical protein